MKRKKELDPSVTIVLKDLRTAAGLTQSDVGELFGVDYKAVGRWETGRSRPHKSYRERFILFLLDTLKLNQDVPRFRKIWKKLMVGEWRWTKLTLLEEWLVTQSPAHGRGPLHPSLPPFPNARQLIGRSQLLEDICEDLTQGSRLALTGMPGVGKTALSIAIAEHPAIQERFNGGILWGHLGQESGVEAILVRWGERLGEDLSAKAGIRQKAEAIKNIIDARPVLIIIDDAWDVSAAFELTCGGRNCAHLLTTRMQELARQYARPKNVFHVPELESAPANELLRDLAPVAYSVNPQRAAGLVDAIGGLPLAIMLLGGFLDAKDRRHFADTQEAALNDMQEAARRLELVQTRLGNTDDSQLTLRRVIELSLDDLSVPDKRAYWSLGAFAPKPSDFSAWAAQYVAQCDEAALIVFLDRNLVETTGQEQLALHQVLSDYARQFCSKPAIERHRDFYVYLAREQQDDYEAIWAMYDQVRWVWQRQREESPMDRSILALMIALEQFQRDQGLLRDRQHLLEASLGILALAEDDEAMIIGLVELGVGRQALGNVRQALNDFDLALTTAQEIGNLDAQVLCHSFLGTALLDVSEFHQAIEHLELALALLSEIESEDSSRVPQLCRSVEPHASTALELLSTISVTQRKPLSTICRQRQSKKRRRMIRGWQIH